MTVPTISSVFPAVGHTGGQAIVEIGGTGFREPTAPEDLPQVDGPVPVQPPTMQVLFGGVASYRVDVLSDTRLFAYTPLHDSGVVDVTLINLDDDGNPIAGETVTATGAYRFRAPALTDNGTIMAVSQALQQEMDRQILKDGVILTVHPEYDDNADDGLDYIDVAKLPVISVIGPKMKLNRLYPVGSLKETDTVAGQEFQRLRIGRVYDFYFAITGVSEDAIEIRNLLESTIVFFTKNWALVVDGQEYLLDLTEDDIDIRPDSSQKLQTFAARCVVKGVPISRIPGIEGEDVMERGAYVETISVTGASKDEAP